MNPVVLVSRSCWTTVREELWRVCPREALMVPLLALRERAPNRVPGSTLGLSDLESLVLATVVTLPPELQRNSGARVEALPGAEEWVNDRLSAFLGRHPRLRACAYLHSHPFAIGATSPSHGPDCDDEGHMRPLLVRNREAGLDASFSFIACREPREGWRLCCFALDEQASLIDLGSAVVVEDEHPGVRFALHPREPENRQATRTWTEALVAAGLSPAQDELFDGWTRLGAELAGDHRLGVMRPRGHPAEPPCLFMWNRPSRQLQALSNVPAIPTRDWLARLFPTPAEAAHASS